MSSLRPVALACALGGLLVAFGGGLAHVAAQALERDLFVSVLDEAGTPVTGLGPDDFVIREDGVRREVLRVRKATDPMDLALIVDNTQMASRHVTDFRKALRAFVDAIMKMDRSQMALVGFADRPTILMNYTRQAAELTAAVDRFFPVPASGSYLMDAFVEVSRGIEKRDAERAVILAISAGGIELSHTYHEQVLSTLTKSGAALHVVSLDMRSDLLTEENRDRAIAFAQATRASGGRYDNILTSMSLERKLSDVAAELANQYRVTYARPQTLIPPERVDVSARNPGLVARGTPIRVPAPKRDK